MYTSPSVIHRTLMNPQQSDLLLQLNQFKEAIAADNIEQTTAFNNMSLNLRHLYQALDQIVVSFSNRICALQSENNQLKRKLSKYENVANFEQKKRKAHFEDQLISKQVSYNMAAKNQLLEMQDFSMAGETFQNSDFAEQMHFQMCDPNPTFHKSIHNAMVHSIQKATYPHRNDDHFKIDLKKGKYAGKKPWNTPKPNTQKGNQVDQPKSQPILQRGEAELESDWKQDHKLKIKQEFQFVSQFVRNYLVPVLEYQEDHKRHMIPKKILLKMYLDWCKRNRREPLIEKHSVIQMSLTNQLKQAFCGMDSYTKNYRGLKFADSYSCESKLEFISDLKF